MKYELLILAFCKQPRSQPTQALMSSIELMTANGERLDLVCSVVLFQEPWLRRIRGHCSMNGLKFCHNAQNSFRYSYRPIIIGTSVLLRELAMELCFQTPVARCYARYNRRARHWCVKAVEHQICLLSLFLLLSLTQLADIFQAIKCEWVKECVYGCVGV